MKVEKNTVNRREATSTYTTNALCTVCRNQQGKMSETLLFKKS